MSRVGKLPVIIPQGVQVNYDEVTRIFVAKGKLGEDSCKIHELVKLDIKPEEIIVSVKNPENKVERSLWGTTRSILNNLVIGVSQGFSKQLELNGVGYKMELRDKLILNLGFSHPVEISVPAEINIKVEKNLLSGTSYSKQAIGDFFTYIHDLRPCEPYKHKGFKFSDRYYIKKEIKK